MLWYILQFVFRLMVLYSLGGQVYGDERFGLECNVAGDTFRSACESQCFNTMGMSHMRFWGFQLAACLIPVFIFEGFMSYYEGQLNKQKKIEAEVEKRKEQKEKQADASEVNSGMDKLVHRFQNRKPAFVNMTLKDKYVHGKKTEAASSTMSTYAFMLCLVIRFTIEIVSMYIGSPLFMDKGQRVVDGQRKQVGTSFGNYLWPTVNPLFYCGLEVQGRQAIEKLGVFEACHTSFLGNRKSNDMNLDCYVPRAFEKSLMSRYMNILSLICLVITMAEMAITGLRIFKEGRESSGKSLPSFNFASVVPFMNRGDRTKYHNESSGSLHTVDQQGSQYSRQQGSHYSNRTTASSNQQIQPQYC